MRSTYMRFTGSSCPHAVLVAAKRGAPWAVEAIYRDLHPSVLSVLRHRAPHGADDLAADVFIAVAQGVVRFQGSEARFRS